MKTKKIPGWPSGLGNLLKTSDLSPAADDDVSERRVGSCRQAGRHHGRVENQRPVQLQDGDVVVERPLVVVALVVNPEVKAGVALCPFYIPWNS